MNERTEDLLSPIPKDTSELETESKLDPAASALIDHIASLLAEEYMDEIMNKGWFDGSGTDAADKKRPLKVIVAGSRTVSDESVIANAIKESGFNIAEVVSGGAKGVDRLGEQWAKGNQIPLKIFPADWKRYNKAAGPIRNLKMAEYADALIAIWDGKSRGTKNMIETARKQGLYVYVHQFQ